MVVIAVAKAPAWGLVVTALAFLWGVGAPAWFWYEYFFLYREDGLPGSLELYKQGQQVSIAIWAALAVSLGALSSSGLFKKAEPNLQGTGTGMNTRAAPATSGAK